MKNLILHHKVPFNLPRFFRYTWPFAAGLTGLGLFYQRMATEKDQHRYAAPGRLIELDGAQRHLYCTGHGKPTVVIDTGLGSYWADWQLVQPEIAKFSQVCTYDRAGYGWSDPSPSPRTSQQFVRELYNLLKAGGIEGPYLLVGHSLGGMNLRLFAAHYPQEVAGLVLVDSAHEEIITRLPFHFRMLLKMAEWLRWPAAGVAHLGLIRLALNQIRPPDFARHVIDQFPADVQPLLRVPRTWPQYADTVLAELAGFEASAAQLTAARPTIAQALADKPLAVITADQKMSAARFRRVVNFSVERYTHHWLTMQRDLAALSSQSLHLTATGSGHSVMVERPALVVETVRQLIEKQRPIFH